MPHDPRTNEKLQLVTVRLLGTDDESDTIVIANAYIAIGDDNIFGIVHVYAVAVRHSCIVIDCNPEYFYIVAGIKVKCPVVSVTDNDILYRYFFTGVKSNLRPRPIPTSIAFPHYRRFLIAVNRS